MCSESSNLHLLCCTPREESPVSAQNLELAAGACHDARRLVHHHALCRDALVGQAGRGAGDATPAPRHAQLHSVGARLGHHKVGVVAAVFVIAQCACGEVEWGVIRDEEKWALSREEVEWD